MKAAADVKPAARLVQMAGHVGQLLRDPRGHWPRLAGMTDGPLASPWPWLAAQALLQLAAAALQAHAMTVPALFARALAGVLLGWGVGSLLVWFWSPRFGGGAEGWRALRLALHAAWPAVLASLPAALLAWLLPLLGVLLQLAGVVGSVLLLRLGLPPLMRVPEARATRCTAAIVASALLLMLLLLLARCATPTAGPAGPLGGTQAVAGAAGPAASHTGLPGRPKRVDEAAQGDGSGTLVIDPEAARRAWEDGMAAASAALAKDGPSLPGAASGALPLSPAPPSQLAELLPETLCGLPRQSLESRLVRFPPTRQGEPQASAEALAEYRGPGRGAGPVLRLTLADRTPAAAVFASLRQSGVLGVQNDRRLPQGWLRLRDDGSSLVEERWDGGRHEAAVRALVADRYLVSALLLQADAPDCARQAIRAVDWRQLQAWAALPPR